MAFIKKINIVGFLLLLFWSAQLCAQNEDNPFEIQYRADKKEKSTTLDSDIIEERDIASENPFNVVRTPPKGKINNTSSENPKVKPAKKKNNKIPVVVDDKNFLFGLTLTMLLLIALITTIYRSQLTRAYRAFTNENVMRMLHREKGTVAYVPYYVLYALFIINAGIYIYLLLRHYNQLSEISNMQLLGYCLGGVSIIYFLKHVVIGFLGMVFPISKETSMYNMTITIFGVVLSILLFVSNIIIAYAPESILSIFIYVSLFLVGAIYLFRSIRGLSIGTKFLNRNKFHFFLYLCTVEIAPILILWKLIGNGIGIQ